MADSSFVPLRKKKKQKQPCANEKSPLQCGFVPGKDGDNIRNKYGIEVDGDDIPDPIETFDEMSLPYPILNYLKRTKHFVKPTPIQMQAIGCLNRSRDIICLSPTGSGKTYGYLLPFCSFLWKCRSSFQYYDSPPKPLCLIVLPTRELVYQVSNVAKDLIQSLHMYLNSTDATRPDTFNIYSTNQNASNVYSANQNASNVYSTNQNASNVYSANQNISNVNCTNVSSNSYQQVNELTINPPQNNHQFFPRNHHIPRFGVSNQYGLHQQQQPFLYENNRALTNNISAYCSVDQPRPPYYNLDSRHELNKNSFLSNPPDTKKQYADHTVVGVCGGIPVKEDLKRLNCGTKILVATPGRLLDLCRRQEVDLQDVRYFVIDECDKSLEMGMEEELRQIVAMVTINEKSCLQTSLWSATLPDSLERLARSAVVDPLYICTGVKDTIPSNISQSVHFVHTYQKNQVLLDVLRKTPYPPVIVFVSSKEKVDSLTEFLQQEQFHAAAIHSGKNQIHRNNVMDAFRGDRVDILVATDLVSRGLDIPTVSSVIHYDTPDTIEDYIHRSGRTGRFGREGQTTTLLTLDCRIAAELKELFESTNVEIPIQLKDTKIFGKKVAHTEMGDRVI